MPRGESGTGSGWEYDDGATGSRGSPRPGVKRAAVATQLTAEMNAREKAFLEIGGLLMLTPGGSGLGRSAEVVKRPARASHRLSRWVAGEAGLAAGSASVSYTIPRTPWAPEGERSLRKYPTTRRLRGLAAEPRHWRSAGLWSPPQRALKQPCRQAPGRRTIVSRTPRLGVSLRSRAQRYLRPAHLG